MAPQTGLEPVTQPSVRLSPPPGGSFYRDGKTVHRTVLPATVNSACRRFARHAALHNRAATGTCTACDTRNKYPPRFGVGICLAPQTGLEPVTPRLTAACSTD